MLDEAAKKPDPEAAILDLKVCDPAVGSGHFLIAAAHRMARRLASVRTGDDEPSPDATREALRDVIGRCLYGVDVNPMAAELCKVSLWMEALVPGRPLSFLDHHIRVGNSLLGATPELIADGIPNDAFKPIEGDDNKLANAYKKRNREERQAWESGQLAFSLRTLDKNREAIERGYEEVEEGEESSVAAVRRKAARYTALQDSEEMFHARRFADAWCAAFVWPKREAAPEAITQGVFTDLSQDAHAIPRETVQEVERIAKQYRFFHWHLAFPNIFDGEDGFDVVLGNPPWDKVQPEEQKFFASLRPDIASASSAAARKKLIQILASQDSTLYALWNAHKRTIDGLSHLAKAGGLYPLTGKGNLNTFRLFSELASRIINITGSAGMIVQTGLATDEGGKEFLNAMLDEGRLVSFLDFENRQHFFPDVDVRFRFALMTLSGKAEAVSSEPARFGWLLQSLDEIHDSGRLIHLTSEDLRLFNPVSRTCPTFGSQRHLDINRQIYQVGRHIYLSDYNRFANIDFLGELFNMTRDSGVFVPAREADVTTNYAKLYEAKCLFQFDHRYATQAGKDLVETTAEQKADPNFGITPRSFVPSTELRRRTDRDGFQSDWMCGFRDVASATNERTAIFAIFPFSAVGNNINLVLNLDAIEAACLVANCNAFVFDFACRQKMSGMHVNIWILKQLPVIDIDRYAEPVPAVGSVLQDWVVSRAVELSYTAWDLEPFARDLGYGGPPFRWDPGRRFLLRCELDAAFFHLYGINRDDADFIMETFPIVKRKDEAAHGEYRTKRVILEIYDHMARAAETGQPYQTPLDPPPVDLDLPASEPTPATVTPLRSRTRPEPGHPALDRAAEERAAYKVQPPARRPEPEELSNDAAERDPAEQTRPATTPPPAQPPGEPQDALFQIPAPETLNLEDAALALHASLPDGQKVQREPLLHDAARQLGHQKLTKKVRSTLNKALNAEHNAGRLKTDWEKVWRPRQ